MGEIRSPSGKTWLPDGVVRIGDESWMQKIRAYSRDEWAGIIEWHVNRETGEFCGGFIAFAGFDGMTSHGQSPANRPTWTVKSFEPLTLSPSLSCSACGNHGFIRDGKWVSC